MRRRLTVWSAAAAVAVAAVALARRRRGGLGPIATTSRAGRMAALGQLGVRTAAGTAVHRTRRVVASPERRESLDNEFALRTSKQVAETLGNMRGAMMKLGQMASFIDEGLPPPLRDALAQLQQSAPPMDPALAAEVIEAELGGPPETVFADWNPLPIAAASIGQVHRARTHDGVEVAVKVQYPGVDAAIRADLDSAGMLFKGIAMVYPGFDSDPLVEELKARIGEELDYRREAANQKLFASFYEGHPFIRIPAVIDDLSTARVLTSSFETGARFDELATWSQAERDLAGETIYRFVFRSMYSLRAFNGDPHPGNYLFRPGGHVTFLDFGLVKHFTEEEVDVFGGMVRGMVLHDDPHEFRRAVERAGLLPTGLEFSDADIAAYFNAFYYLVARPEPLTVEPTYSSELVRRFFDVNGPYGPIMKVANLPPAFVIVQRINLGLVAVLGLLRATANWRCIAEELWPWVEGPPTTELGRLEAAWRSAHAQP